MNNSFDGSGSTEPGKDSEQLKIILLATQPRMLREMLHRALEKASDMQLVVETDTPDQVSALLSRVQADWLVTTLDEDNRLAEPVRSAIAQNPDVSVIGLSADGSHAEVRGTEGVDGNRKHERYHLDDISLSDLMSILRNND